VTAKLKLPVATLHEHVDESISGEESHEGIVGRHRGGGPGFGCLALTSLKPLQACDGDNALRATPPEARTPQR